MRRRDFLGWTAAGLATGGVAEAATEPSPAQARREARRLARALDRLEAVSASSLDNAAAPRREARLVRSTMRTLLVADTVSALPPALRGTPEVDEAVIANAAEVDYVLQAHLRRLASLSEADEARYRKVLKADPELPGRLTAQIDAIAVEAGLGLRQRKRLRDTVRHVSWRLERQSLDAVLGDVMGQVTRQLSQLEGPLPGGYSAGDTQRWAEALGEWPVSAAPVSDPNAYDGRFSVYAYRMMRIAAFCGFGAGVLLLLGPGSGGASAVLALFPITAVVVLLTLGVIFLLIDSALAE